MARCPLCGSENLPDAAACRACAAPLRTTVEDVHALPPGTSLQEGGYTVERVLGQGGFGITYAARDRRLGREVALKEFYPQGSARQGALVRPARGVPAAEFAASRERFLEEARILARFQHPGIVHVYASFEENETAHMVMELLRGRSLAGMLEDRGALPEHEATAYVRTVGEALETVHSAGLLHRDIKPDNIIAVDDGRVVLIDFGTAREFAAELTRRMTALLTPGYAPLEQYGQQARFGPYTDVYALAATLYHLLTGQPPVPALDRVQGVALAPPHALKPDVGRAVSDAVMWGLEMKVQARPQSAREFLQALGGQAGRPAGAAPQPAAGAAAPRHPPFRFRHEEAATLPELVAVSERNRHEAQDYLYSGQFERWLVGSAGQGALADRARAIARSRTEDRARGLELFLRELAEAAGEPAFPRLAAVKNQMDLGRVPAGAQVEAGVRLRNEGRGQAWGTVSIQPELPGLSTDPQFESGTARIGVRLDALHAPPGSYQASLVVAPDGVPDVLRIPIRYEVVPLQVTIRPEEIELGFIPRGETREAVLEITAAPPGGRLAGTAHLEPGLPGVELSPFVAGPRSELTLRVNSQALDSGRHAAEVRIRTNAGTFAVPVRLRVGLRWDVVAGRAIRGSAALAVPALLGRWLLGEAIGPGGQAWMLTLPDTGRSWLPLTLFGGAVVSSIAALYWPQRRRVAGNTRGLARFTRLALAGLALMGFCCGGFSILPALGAGGFAVLENAAAVWRGLGLQPWQSWCVNGLLFGLLHGAAAGLARAGKTRLAGGLHWAGGLVFLLLALFGRLSGG